MASAVQISFTISLVLVSLFIGVSHSDTCDSYAGGNVYPHTTFGKGHELYYSKVQISKPAPDWTATGIVNGQIREVKLKVRGEILIEND